MPNDASEIRSSGRLSRLLTRRTSRPLRVLAIDGGGIRGILAVMVLAELERRTGKPVAELFDFIAGTSTGALVALGLTVPDEAGKPRYSARQVATFYEEFGAKVFSRSVWHQIRAVGNLADGKYPAPPASKEMLDELFGGARLSDCPGRRAGPELRDRAAHPLLLQELARHRAGELRLSPCPRWCGPPPPRRPTSSRPTSRPTARATISLSWTARLVAYNPGALRLCGGARQLYPEAKDFLVVSLGTGATHPAPPLRATAKDWGAARWAEPIFSIMCDSSASAVDHQLEQLLPPGPHGLKRYYRFQVRLDTGSDDMDDASGTNHAGPQAVGRGHAAQEPQPPAHPGPAPGGVRRKLIVLAVTVIKEDRNRPPSPP